MSEKHTQQSEGALSTIPPRKHYTTLQDRYEMQYVIPADIPSDSIEMDVLEEENVLTVRGRVQQRETLPVLESGEEKVDVYYSTFEHSVRLPKDGNLTAAKTQVVEIDGDLSHHLLKVHVPILR